MNIITTTEALAAVCDEAANEPYVTLDTEFLRERTYYAKLCLVQMALPGKGPDRAYIIDPLAEGLSLDPLLELMRNPDVVKVFHAARQDLEIFFIDGGVIPQPLFDTQIAAMVCGFGEQVGYETLVKKIARAPLDKTSRFTDWSQRPLSDAQLRYALDDVTHLRQIYEHLKKDIEKSGRAAWVAEEMAVLTSPDTYVTHPEDAWQKVRTRGQSGKFMAMVKELARFREDYAQTRNVPRSRVYKDDALLELASTKPDSLEALGRSRLLLREARRGEIADGILEAVQHALALNPKDWPRTTAEEAPLQVNPALADLLRVLLKAKADSAGVAQKLIAPTSDLDAIAAGKRDVDCLKGWRRELFGADALRLCAGELALAAKGQQVQVIELQA
ncbi:ribonuclease D [Pararhodobacter sp. CCB-MM2]|uniref:ribonuclease D n=1 Tax=Pararhodobacter sp. CCB-MM2 TaxID=1786003 RepID=UPI00082F58B6|nr:ribonuclease D [Pararhodobacter sp. CCB-MM2]